MTPGRSFANHAHFVLALGAAVAVSGCGRLGFDVDSDGAVDVADDVSSATCTAVGQLTDDFEDGVTSPRWIANQDPPVVVAETGGQLIITLADALSGVRYGGYDSTDRHDFRDHCAFVTVNAVPRAAPEAEMTLQLTTSSSAFGIQAVDGSLRAYTRLPDTTYVLHAAAPFDPSEHRHWKVRETEGTMSWETSPDRRSWTVQFSEPTSLDISAVGVALFAGTFEPITNPGEAVFDDFNRP